MATEGALLRSLEGNLLAFWCPGCDMAHAVRIGVPDRPCWAWNGNCEAPTFEPSVLVTWFKISAEGLAMIERKDPPPDGKRYPGADMVCHTFVREGVIQFLGDCTHALAGQNVPMPAWPLWKSDQENPDRLEPVPAAESTNTAGG